MYLIKKYVNKSDLTHKKFVFDTYQSYIIWNYIMISYIIKNNGPLHKRSRNGISYGINKSGY